MAKRNAFLHLSDIHISNFEEKYSGKTILSNISKYDKYINIFIENLNTYIDENGIVLKTIIITGDLANSGEKEDYEQIKIFLDEMKEGFKLKNTDILFVPGNHDINWYNNTTAWRENKEKKEFEFHEAKLHNFKYFFDNYYSDRDFIFDSEKAISIVKSYPDIKLCFIGLNSNYKESFSGTDHYGFINEDSLHDEMKEVVKKYSGYKMIAFWHHNPNYIENEKKTLKNWGTIQHILSKYSIFNYLFGHTHKDESSKIVLSDSYSFFSIGSFGKSDSNLSNSFNLFVEESIDNENAKFNRSLFIFMPKDSETYQNTGYWEEQKNIKDNKELIISLKRGYTSSSPKEIKSKIKNPLESSYTAEVTFEQDSLQEKNEIIKSNENEILNIVKNKKLVKSGHFHWGNNRKTRTWIDTNLLLSTNKVLGIVRNDFLIKLRNIKSEFNLNPDLIIGLGIEGNIIGSPLSLVFNCYYSYFPVPARNDHNKFEKQLIDGSYETIVLVTDVVFEGKTIKDFINNHKTFFSKAQTIVILSIFSTGENVFKITSSKKEFNKTFIFRYITDKIKIERCSLDAEKCSICKLNLENVHYF